MANRRASVWKYVKVGKVWRYCRPVTGANNKIRPDWVLVNGRKEHHPEGNYYVHYLEGEKQKWEKIGNVPANAVNRAKFRETYFQAVAQGIPVKPTEERPPLMIAYTLDNYLEEYRLSKRPESYGLMKQTLYEFQRVCHKNIISQITRLDLLKYKAWLVERGRSVRTAGNKMLRVNQYLRAVQGLKPGEGVVTVKDAKFVELEPEIYDEADLERFFANCNAFQFAVFQTLLMSGLRKQELENLTWDDVNFTVGTITVSASAGFTPKDWEQRTIEVPTKLLNILQTLTKNGKYVFATRSGNRYTHMWDDCRTIAEAAGVKNAHPHKFRAHYATTLLHSGLDLKTVQKLLGHKNLESTMRYLAKAKSHEVRAKVDIIWNMQR
jgi:integrase/recombinase XerD